MAWEHPACQGGRMKPSPATGLDASHLLKRSPCALLRWELLSRERRMDKLTFWKRLRETFSGYRSQLRFSLRMTAAGLLALIVAQSLALPLHGLWVVLTAVVVTQMSVGGSLRATIEYTIGTLGGAIYAAAIGVLVPHAGAIAQCSVRGGDQPEFSRCAVFSCAGAAAFRTTWRRSNRVGVHSISGGRARRCNRVNRFAAGVLPKSSSPGSGGGCANPAAYGQRLSRAISGLHATARCNQNATVARRPGQVGHRF